MNIGLGITTFNRPNYFNKTITEVIKFLKPHLSILTVYNDGSKEPYSYPEQIDIIHNETENKGVAHAKNVLLRDMMIAKCDYLFILEDDVFPTSDRALFGYIDLCNSTGIKHFNFAHHGPANAGGPLMCDEDLSLYPHCVGAYSFYTKECIEKVGYLDEHFKNAWEHVEHTARIAREGLTSPFWMFADHRHSADWLQEIPGAIENSSIRHTPEWTKNMEEGLTYWKEKDGIGLPPHI